MADISKILGNDYLFSWVDGIYFTEIKNKTIEVLEYLEKLNYNYSIETLKNFKSVKKEKHFLINFDKGKENKLFNIPISSYGWQNDFYTWNNNRIKELNELNEKIK